MIPLAWRVKLKLTGNCLTTAMGILPHDNIEEALTIALLVDTAAK